MTQKQEVAPTPSVVASLVAIQRGMHGSVGVATIVHLSQMGLIDSDGKVTDHGKRVLESANRRLGQTADLGPIPGGSLYPGGAPEPVREKAQARTGHRTAADPAGPLDAIEFVAKAGAEHGADPANWPGTLRQQAFAIVAEASAPERDATVIRAVSREAAGVQRERAEWRKLGQRANKLVRAVDDGEYDNAVRPFDAMIELLRDVVRQSPNEP